MVKSVLGIVGGSGFYNLPGIENPHWEKVVEPVGRALRRDPVRRDRRPAVPLPAAARARPSHLADAHQLPRQHRRAEARRRHRPRLDLRLRLAEGSVRARPLRARRPVHRPHLRAREELLRRGLRRARVDGPSGEPAAGRARSSRRPRPRTSTTPRAAPISSWRARSSRRAPNLPLPQLGLRRDRHDQHAGSQARPRGGDLLRDRRHGHRLRLLARRAWRTSTSPPCSPS